MLVREENSLGLIRLCELPGVSARLLPFQDVERLAAALAIEFVIEIGPRMIFPVVNVHGGKKEARAIRAVEGKSHRMKFVVARLELEHGETERAIFRENIPAL